MIAPGPKSLSSDDQAENDPAEQASLEEAVDPASPGEPASKPRLKRSQILIGVIFGSVVTFLAGVVVLIALNSDSLPVLTEDRLETARYLWRNSKIDSYSMVLELKGVQPGKIEIEVEDGEPTRLVRDGEVPDRRTWDVWTVEGQFETIERDFANRENSQETFGVANPEQVLMYAVFDGRDGHPTQYRRMVQGRPYTVEWIVTEFKPRGR